MKTIMTLFMALFSLLQISAQSQEQAVRSIYNEALTNGKSYQTLEYLSLNIGHRLSGSPQAAAAVEFTRQKMTDFGFDTVYLQPVMVPHWVRGEKEVGRIIGAKTMGVQDVTVIALGNSVGTGTEGILAEVVEVSSLDELAKLGKKKLEGKIVFFNRPMDPNLINTGHAYGGAVDQRVFGASEASKYGAKAMIVRSMTLAMNDIPHTGTLRYRDDSQPIPAVAISTVGAELLSKSIKSNAGLQFYVRTTCQMLPDVLSYNVIGEIKGGEKSNEYIVVGGHLDSWDVGDGSHDDGAGCVQSMEVLRIFIELGIQPKRTIRAVMYMNEENGIRGGIEYARVAKEKAEIHIAALESDSGGFTPRGFGVNDDQNALKSIQSWSKILDVYDLQKIEAGHGGADINPLKEQGTVCIGLEPDTQRYFDYHHTTEDTFDKVNKRELELGAAAMASLVYLIDQNGL